jgi:predicted nicotinamide N-methyase
MPYWAELWPAGVQLAGCLPAELAGVRVVELGCGLGLPSLVAAARGAAVTSIDWAEQAIELLHCNAERNGLELTAVHADWRNVEGLFDLTLGADLLYEARNVDALLDVLPALAPEVLLAEPGRPGASEFLDRARERWTVERLAPRVYRLTRTVRAGRRARPDG